MSLSVNFFYRAEFIQPICLPVSPAMKDVDLENKMVSVAGWGQTDIGGNFFNN